MQETEQQAFVLRVSPSGNDKVSEALSTNQIIIGWAKAEGLLEQSLSWEQFRAIISSEYYSDESNMRRAGGAAGNMWRFIREMQVGDFVVVPHGSEFYVAKVKGPATYDSGRISDDTAYRRDVEWQINKKPIPRMIAKSALISRMKTYGTCVNASDIIEEINDSLKTSLMGIHPTFHTELRMRLIEETLKQLHHGRIDERRFEELIKSILEKLGAQKVRIVSRQKDKGADLLATFLVAGTFKQVVAVQAKYWKSDPGVREEVVNQLIKGIEAESADLGVVITSGTISPKAIKAAQDYYDKEGIKIEFVDGEQLAKLIVEHGTDCISTVPRLSAE